MITVYSLSKVAAVSDISWIEKKKINERPFAAWGNVPFLSALDDTMMELKSEDLNEI